METPSSYLLVMVLVCFDSVYLMDFGTTTEAMGVKSLYNSDATDSGNVSDSVYLRDIQTMTGGMGVSASLDNSDTTVSLVTNVTEKAGGENSSRKTTTKAPEKTSPTGSHTGGGTVSAACSPSTVGLVLTVLALLPLT